MQLKTIEIEGKTYAAIEDGKPVYVDGGKELPFDVPAMHAKIGSLNAEAKTHREDKEAALTKLATFEGIDPEAARKAVETMSNFDDGKLMDAEKARESQRAAVEAATKAYEAKVGEQTAAREAAEAALRQEMIGGAFARSKFVSEGMTIPADMVEARFGSQFAIEDGRPVAKDTHGNVIYSKSSPGEIAGFDEALETLVGAYPQRDNILKGLNHNGSGAKPNDGGGSGQKTMAMSEFNALSAKERSARMSAGTVLTD